MFGAMIVHSKPYISCAAHICLFSNHCCHSARRHKAVSKSWKVSPTALRMVLAFKDDGASYQSEVGYSLYLEDHPMYQVVSKWGWTSIVWPLLHLLHGIIYFGDLVFRVSKTTTTIRGMILQVRVRGAVPSRCIVIVVGCCRRDIMWYPNLWIFMGVTYYRSYIRW